MTAVGRPPLGRIAFDGSSSPRRQWVETQRLALQDAATAITTASEDRNAGETGTAELLAEREGELREALERKAQAEEDKAKAEEELDALSREKERLEALAREREEARKVAKEKKEAIINRHKIIRCKSCNASPTRVSK